MVWFLLLWVVQRRIMGRCGLVSTQHKEQPMEPRMVRVGKYFINLTNLFWAEVTVSSQDATKRWIDLTYGDLRLHLTDEEAEEVIHFLALHSQDVSSA
jgi:hypothetical protein